MKKLVHICSLFALCFSISSAQNLVPNPSYEVYTACPSSWGQLTNCTPWINGAGTCDFMHACATTASYRTPTNNFGSQTPSTGNGYIGMVTMTNFGWYEHAGVPLISPLVPGTTYNVSMNVSLADVYPQYMCNRIGFLFTNSATDPGIPGTAHVFTTAVVSSNTTWTTISGTFTPAISYTHVFIGSFFPWASMTNLPTGYGSYASGYYYFDDISVTPTGPLDSRTLGLTVSANDNHQVNLEWSPEGISRISRFEVEHSLDAEHFTDAGTFDATRLSATVNPLGWNVPVYYRVRAIDADGNTFTSPIRTCTINEPGHTTIDLYPNPAQPGSSMYLRILSGDHSTYLVTIYGLDGKQVSSFSGTTAIGMTEVELNPNDLPSGSYVCKVVAGSQSTTHRIIIP